MESRFSEQYLEFRDSSLSLLEVENVRAAVKMLVLGGKTGYIVFKVGPAQRRVEIHVHISNVLNRLSLLGGHLVRPGDPKPSFQEDVDRELALIAKEEGHAR